MTDSSFSDLKYSDLEAPAVGGPIEFSVGDILIRATWLGVVADGRGLGAAMRLAGALELEREREAEK